jgi:hypothetical protein
VHGEIMTDDRQDSYNKFENLPLISYSIIKYLIDNEDEMWKILKYTSPDAWDKPNLTKAEKGALVYAGQENETDFRVFMDVGNDNSWTVEACFIRISPITALPANYVNGALSIGCEVYSHYRINTMSNYQTRIETVTQRLIKILNGADIENVGRMYFDLKASPACKSIVIGAIPYKGRATIFCNHALG